MKFLVKINRNYSLLFAAVLFISSLAGYFILNKVIMETAEESLIEKKKLLVEHIKENDEIPNLYPLLEVKKVDRVSDSKPGFKLIWIQNEDEDETEPYIEYSEEIEIGNVLYSLKLRQSSFENEDLIIIISLYFFTIILVSLGITLFISRKINRTIWAQFETNLESIENFNFGGQAKISLEKSNIEEFDRLNQVITTLTEKLSLDYFSLKEFTENASHEIQTPLASALLQLDEVLQQNLNQEAAEKTMSAIQSMKRLSSLNQSLILLTKIENLQFVTETEFLFNDLIKRKLKEFETLFSTKKLEVSFIEISEFRLKIHEDLANLILNNLLSNSINHNLQGGIIQVLTTSNTLKICNTGETNNLNNETIFNRFTKGNSKSYGLGLAIVKKICDTHELDIRYEKNDLHCIIITKKS